MEQLEFDFGDEVPQIYEYRFGDFKAEDYVEARKDDQGKPRYDLVPLQALEEVVYVLMFGAKKNGDHNWKKGMAWSRMYAAALRHLFAFWRGEDTDEDTGYLHLAHAACCILFLLSYQQTATGSDDRPVIRGKHEKAGQATAEASSIYARSTGSASHDSIPHANLGVDLASIARAGT